MIERTYALDNQHSVSRFLVTNPDLLASLGLAPGPAPCAERVLVAEDDEGMDLAVYLESALLERLAGTDPLEDLHDDNLGDFLTALEGLSSEVHLRSGTLLVAPVTLAAGNFPHSGRLT